MFACLDKFHASSYHNDLQTEIAIFLISKQIPQYRHRNKKSRTITGTRLLKICKYSTQPHIGLESIDYQLFGF